MPPPPCSTLFPYTTLFRSRPPHGSRARAGPAPRRCPGGRRSAARRRSAAAPPPAGARSEEHTSELQSRRDLVCRLPLEKKINASNLFLSLILHLGNLFLIV